VNAKTSPGEGEKKRDWKGAKKRDEKREERVEDLRPGGRRGEEARLERRGAKKLDWKGEGRSAEERFVDKLVLVWRDPHK